MHGAVSVGYTKEIMEYGIHHGEVVLHQLQYNKYNTIIITCNCFIPVVVLSSYVLIIYV